MLGKFLNTVAVLSTVRNMSEPEQTIVYEAGDWVALVQPYSSDHVIPYRVGKPPTVPFGAVGKVIHVTPPEQGQKETLYHIAFHAGWTALRVPGSVLRHARMLEQLALCADGC